MRTLAKVITTSAERKIPVAASHSSAQWTLENGEYIESTPTFEQKSIDAYKLTDLVKVSIELLQDSAFDLETYIAGEFARASELPKRKRSASERARISPPAYSRKAAAKSV